jgi:2,4-dienoyl-CoA reductase-like NADH-dependent reductase (Old Yellow Enzyme family)/thioredoxin reductase
MELLEPYKIGHMPLRNRIVMAPMSLNLTENGYVTDKLVCFCERRAKGGVGLITIGDGIVDTPVGNNVKESTAIDSEKYIPKLRELVEAVKAHGAKIAMQLSHGGRRAGRISKQGYLEVTRGQMPVAPSALPHPVPGQVVPRELSREEIREIVEKFGQATRWCIEAGFDAIGLHCAHMYLCGEFLSPWANQREDEYGGDFEGRLRFVLEVIARIRNETGEKYPLIVRMNGEEPQGGNSMEDIQRIARRFEEAGVDAIHVSVGFGAPTKTRGLIPSVSPMRAPSGCIVHLAENVKKAVSIPVIAVSKLGNVSFAESVLQEERADLIALGRPLIADPDLPLKVMEGRVEDIRPCIYCCQGCLGNVLGKDAPVACSINPTAGREIEDSVETAKQKKRVIVLGAGPSGMQAALTAAERGHEVYLVEKAEHMGGQLLLACRPPGKADIEPFRKYLEDQVRKSGVRWETGKEVNAAWLDEIKPDAAILAMGSESIVAEIEGSRKKRIWTAREILMTSEIEGKNIMVLGGGQVGCEVAEFLAEGGKKVTIVEILGDIAREMESINRLSLTMSLEDHGVKIMTKSEVMDVTEEGIWVDCLGDRKLLPVDGIVMAVGSCPRREDVESLVKEKVPEVYTAGDQVRAAGILEAVREGYEAAKNI